MATPADLLDVATETMSYGGPVDRATLTDTTGDPVEFCGAHAALLTRAWCGLGADASVAHRQPPRSTAAGKERVPAARR